VGRIINNKRKNDPLYVVLVDIHIFLVILKLIFISIERTKSREKMTESCDKKNRKKD